MESKTDLIKLDEIKNIAIINFSKNYYLKNIILEVCNEFTEYLFFVLNDDEDSFILNIFQKDKTNDFKESVMEFLNFILGIQVSRLNGLNI